MIETIEEAGLAYYASYYINGDASGLTDDEIADADAWLASVQPSEPEQHAEIVGCGDESYIGRYRGRLAGMIDYQLIVYKTEITNV
jgi:hypothetical protein